MKQQLFAAVLSIGIASGAAAQPGTASSTSFNEAKRLEPQKIENNGKTQSQGTLSLDELIKHALENNQELKATRHEVLAEEAEIGPAGALPDPMLGVNAMNLPTNSLSLRDDDMSGVEVSLSQMIPFPGKRAKLREAARKTADAAEMSFEEKKWQIVKRVKDLYYELYLAHQRETLIEDQKKIVTQMISAMRSQYTLGKVPQAAILSLQVEEANLIEESLKSESDIKVKQNELNHVLGHSHTYLSGRPEQIKNPSIDFQNMTEDEAAKFVASNSPRLKAMQAAVEAREARLDYAKKEYLPDFQVMAGYTFRQPTRMGSDGTDMVSAGVGITLPIWASSKQSEQVKGAAAQKAKTEAELRDMRLMIEHEARGAFAELREAQKRVELFEGGLMQLTQQAVASGRSAYLTGKMDFATLLEALRTQYKTNYAYQEALAKREMKIAQLEALASRALGAK